MERTYVSTNGSAPGDLCPYSPGEGLRHAGTMFAVRFHGRGGQGAVTAADLLALAAFEEGRYAQSFPNFGSERMGAPVVAYCRLDERGIRTREPVVTADCLIVLDPTLVHQVDLFAGLDVDGYVLVNSTRTLDELGLGSLAARFRPERLLTVPATEVALRQTGRPLPNAALLGSFAALTAEVTIGAVSSAIRERFSRAPSVAERNVAAAAELFRLGCQVMTASGRAVLGAPAD